jgi:hypothetical protein
LADGDLPYLVDEMCAAGAFTEKLSAKHEPGVLFVGLGPMTELVLRECIEVAQRKGGTPDVKAKWLRHVMVMAGVVQPAGGE